MRFIVFVLLAGVLAACGSPKPAASPARVQSAAANPYANGHSIFLTGRDLQGNPITASPRPLRASCAACHGQNGAGGFHLPDGAVSADLRHKALVSEQKHPYTIALLERAISTGVDNDGDKLDPVMPRWRMSKTDLHDVAEYVYQHLK